MRKKLRNITPHLLSIGGYEISGDPSMRPEFTQPGALAFTISRAFTFILPLIGLVGFIYFMWAGFQYLMSKGDPKALAAAQARLTYATIGLIIVSLAYSLTAYATNLFGFIKP